MQDANLPGGETPSVPYRWLDALVAGLAFRLGRIYPPQMPNMDPMAFRSALKADADEAWKSAAEQDVENVPLVLAPSLSRYYR